MERNARDAAKLVLEAEKQHVLFMVGQNQRFTPEVQLAQQTIQKGELGDVYYAKTHPQQEAPKNNIAMRIR